MIQAHTDLQKAIHNPAILSREALKRMFVARKKLLELLLQDLRQPFEGTAGQQHVLLIGPRGMGKTTLLLRIQYAVEDDPDLSSRWLPICFLEETYRIGDLADFWLEALRNLDAATGGSSASAHAARLLKRHRRDADALAEAAFRSLKERCLSRDKQALVLVDNLQEVFGHIGDERQLHQLRATLMAEPWVKVIGCAPSYFDQIELSSAPFYEFFAIHVLRGVSEEETLDMLVQWAKHEENPSLVRRLKGRRGRIRSLHQLTGGNPRLLAVLYDVVKEGPLQTAFEDLEVLVDHLTPYFKALTDSLPVQMRRLVDALARRWEPVLARDLAEDLRLETNVVSAHLSRLHKEGWVEKLPGPGRSARYQLIDRFYNIAYLMRHARNDVDRLKAFVHFLRVMYEDEDLAENAAHLALEFDPNATAAHWMLVDIANAWDDYPAEESHLRTLESLEPDDPTVLEALAENLLKQHRDEEALDLASRALDMAPRNTRLWLIKARALWHLERYDEAEQALDEAARLEPGNPGPILVRAALYASSSAHKSEVLPLLESASHQFPDSVAVWTRLARAHLAQAGDPDALKSAEKALTEAQRLDPERRDVVLLTAKVRAAQGRWRESLGLVQRLLVHKDLRAGEERALLSLCMRIAAQGDPEEVGKVIDEQGFAQDWAPMRLALTILSGTDPDAVNRAAKEVADLARTLVKKMTALSNKEDTAVRPPSGRL